MSFRELTFENIEVCPLCGSPEFMPFDEGVDTLCTEINRYLPQGEQKLPTINNRRVICLCGLVYMSPRLNAASLSHVYRLWYGHAYHSIFTDSNLIEYRTRQFELYYLPLLSRWAEKPGRLLDVGCGSGLFLSLAALSGWNTTGIEFDGPTAQWGKEKFGIDIRSGTISSALKVGEYYDVITMFDYLEHTPTPAADLDALSKHLLPGGLLIIRVPNQNGFQSRIMGSRWLAVICNHLSYFTDGTLSSSLKKRGFHIETVTAHNYQTQRDIFKQRLGWFVKRIININNHNVSSDNSTQLPMMQSTGPWSAACRLLHSLFVEQIDHIGGRFNSGNNLMIIARKGTQ